MRQAVCVDEVLRGIEHAAREGMDAGLRAGGAVLPPAVHLLAEDLDQPYVGYLTCRPFYRGADAAAAIVELGELPSVLAVTRLAVTWEAYDLTVALQVPADPDTLALVVLDATLTEHAIRWCPFRLHAGTGRYGDMVVPEWGPPALLRDPPLPGPVEQLLTVWRQWRAGDLDETITRLETAGHRMRWAAR